MAGLTDIAFMVIISTRQASGVTRKNHCNRGDQCGQDGRKRRWSWKLPKGDREG